MLGTFQIQSNGLANYEFSLNLTFVKICCSEDQTSVDITITVLVLRTMNPLLMLMVMACIYVNNCFMFSGFGP